jgi:predicted permease
VLAVIVACFLAGILLRRGAPATHGWVGPLDRVVLWVLLPALIVAKLPSAELGAAIAVPVAVAWGTLVVAWATVLLLSHRFGWSRTTTGALLMMASFGNTSFLGLGAVEALLGRDHLPAALAFDQLGNFLALATVGTVITSRWGHGEAGVRDVVRRVLTFPPFVALLVAGVLRHWPLPDDVTDVLGSVGRLVSPVAMFAIGLRFRWPRGARIWRRASVCLTIKMVVMPAVALAAAVVAGGLDDPAWRASVLEAGMPPMVTASLMASQAGLDEELSTFVVGAGLLVAVVTLPLLRLAIG